MEVGATSQATQMQTQMQMKKMDGTGGGQGNGNGGGGMKDIMQSLPSEERVIIQEQMSALSKENKIAAKEQMAQIDPTSMSGDDFMQSLLEILTPTASEDTTEVYA